MIDCAKHLLVLPCCRGRSCNNKIVLPYAKYLPKTLLFFILFPVAALAQNPAKWSLESEAKGSAVRSGDITKVLIRAAIEPKWHLYALDQPPGGPIATTIKVTEGRPFEIVGAIRTAKPRYWSDPNFIVDGKELETKFFEDQASFDLDVSSKQEAEVSDFAFDVRYQLCNDTFCLPPKTVRVSFSGAEDVKKPSLSSVGNRRSLRQAPISS